MKASVVLRCVIISMLFAASSAGAQNFPNKPITLLQPYGPGVSLDVLSRFIGTKLNERLKWTIIADNRPGADGVIAVQALLKAPADGYTLLGSISTLAILPTSKKGSLPYDPLKDLVPLTRTINLQSMLSANPSVPANNLAELIAYSKANPGKLSYGTAGKGSWNHLLGELLKRETGLDMTNIPYKAGTQMETEVIGGSINLVVVSAPSVIQHIKAGKLKPLVVVSNRRYPGMPDVPSLAESIKGFATEDVDPWGGWMVRSGLPPDILNRLYTEVVAVLKMPETRDQIIKMAGAPIIDESLDAAYRKYAADIARWEKVVREVGVTFD